MNKQLILAALKNNIKAKGETIGEFGYDDLKQSYKEKGEAGAIERLEKFKEKTQQAIEKAVKEGVKFHFSTDVEMTMSERNAAIRAGRKIESRKDNIMKLVEFLEIPFEFNI